MILNIKGRAEGLGVTPGTFSVETNCYHVHVYRDGKCIWKRAPQDDNWYDKEHQAMIGALNVLEKVLKDTQ